MGLFLVDFIRAIYPSMQPWPMKNRDGAMAYLRDAATLDELIFHVANNVPAISNENITGLPRVVR